MWECRAVLSDGTVCNTSNFDDNAKCSKCEAPRQANVPQAPGEPHVDALELGGKLFTGAKSAVQLGADKAREYAPVARELGKQAKDKAADIAYHSRLATHTGVHPVSIIAFCALLLLASAILPVALGWPMDLRITNRTDRHELAVGRQPGQQLEGAQQETLRTYEGKEYVANFKPTQIEGARRMPLLVTALLAGPIFVTGSPVVISGTGVDEEGGKAQARVVLELSNGNIFWLSAAVLLLMLIIADVLVGDIYAMQKLLISLTLVWTAYCVLMGMISQYMVKDIAMQLFPESLSLGLSVNGLMTAPVKIGFLGLIYWMSSIVIRNLTPAGRRAAAARSAL